MYVCVCATGDSRRKAKLCLNAAYAHDPALIPEQARSNMAACTTTKGELERERQGGS